MNAPQADIAAATAAEPEGPARRGLLVLMICVLAGALDGYDTQMIGYVATTISAEWGVPISALGMVLSSGLVGLVLGGVTIGPLSDRFGRNRVLLASSLVIAVTTIGVIFCTNVYQLSVVRFVTGLALGAMTANLVALAYESASPRWRSTAVAVTIASLPLGGFVGAMLSAWVLSRYSWQLLFEATAALAFILSFALLLVPRSAPPPRAAVQPATGPAQLFRYGRARFTTFLWLALIANLIISYVVASWFPALMQAGGASVSDAAVALGVVNVGAAAGSIVVGMLFARWGVWVLVSCYVALGCALMLVPTVGDSPMLAKLIGFTVGLCIVGPYACINMLAAAEYPPAMRATGVGWSQGIGRGFAVGATSLVGMWLASGVTTGMIFFIVGSIALVGAFAMLILGRLAASSTSRGVEA